MMPTSSKGGISAQLTFFLPSIIIDGNPFITTSDNDDAWCRSATFIKRNMLGIFGG